jgi:hypothetical protein|tara:strand:+ start:5122 stop:5376 length:255 start_codon:yes stop_codon:yes gene_type:complete
MKFNKDNILEILLLTLSIYVLLRYSLDFKVIYPKILLELYEEPMFKIVLYILLYILSTINIKYAIVFFIFLVFLEFDYILFIKE